MNYVRSLLRAHVLKLVIAVSLILVCGSKGEAQLHPSGGPDSIVVYNKDLQPVRRIANLPAFTTCATASSDSFALAVPSTNSVLHVNGLGAPGPMTTLAGGPQRISGYKDGYLVVTHHGVVDDIGIDGKLRRELGGQNAINAIMHPEQPGMIVVRASGDVVHVTWDGEIKARYNSDSNGRAVSIKDVALEGQNHLVALDSLSNELVVLDLSLKEERRVPAPFDLKEIAAIQSGAASLIALPRDKTSVRLFSSDGTTSSFRTKLPVTCAVGLNNDNFGLGISSTNTVYVPSDFYADLDGLRPQLTYDCLFAVIAYALCGSLAFVYFWKRLTARTQGTIECASAVSPPVSHYTGSKLLCGLAFLLTAVGLTLSWWIYPLLRATGAPEAWGYYWLGACVAGTSLLYLCRKGGVYQGLSALKSPDAPCRGSSVSWTLIVLALCCVGALHYMMQHGSSPKWIVASWIVGQVLFIRSFSTSANKTPWKWTERASVILLLAVTAASRVYKWTECPPNIHFDFGIIAEEAVIALYKDWYPIFDLRAGQTIGRPWLLQMAASTWAFGVQEWAIRFPSLVWTVALSWACYLLGRELISHRFGLIFGTLVAAQHNLLAYSRLPYVTESTAPFVFCLYFLCRGLRRHSFRDWALSGAWAGWSMMTIRTFTTFPLIGAGIFLFVCLFHLRTIWKHRLHVLAMASSIGVVFGPYYYFYTSQQHLSYRLAGTSPLFSDYKFNTDISVWIFQMEAAFGAILRQPDRPPWPSESLDPICLALTGSLFGAGLIMLVLRLRSLPTPIALIAMGGSIAFGSGFLTNPPTYYHHFIGLVFVMFIVAVPLGCLCDTVLAVRPKWFARCLVLGPLAVISLSVIEQTKPFMAYCAWSFEGKDISLSPRGVYSLLSEHLLSRRERRFVLVSYPEKGADFHHANCSIFYGQFSERHQVNTPITAYLPMRPTAQPKAIEFISLYNPSQLDDVKKIYPGGVDEQFIFASGEGKMFTYTVSAEQNSAAYLNSFSTGALLDKNFYALERVS